MVINSTHVDNPVQRKLTKLHMLSIFDRKKRDYFLSSANEKLDLIERETG